MSRTARELKQFARDYDRIATVNETWLESAGEPSDQQAAVRCLSVGATCFNNLLLLAKLQWRHDLADPRPTLGRGAALAGLLAGFTRHFAADELVRVPFPFPSAAFAVRLLEGSVPDSIRRALPRGKTLDMFFHERVPDALLLKALDSGRKPAGWDALVSELRAARSDLYADTYDCLMGIVQSAAKGRTAEALALIEQADELYPRRAKDMPNFANNDGGGPFNDLMVDHRLAAVIQHCFAAQPAALAQIRTIHLWRWSDGGAPGLRRAEGGTPEERRPGRRR